MFGKTKHIHFVGIGGIGMSGMAELLYNNNFIISGSDINISERTEYLNKIGIPITGENQCVAPIYDNTDIIDKMLIEKLENLKVSIYSMAVTFKN